MKTRRKREEEDGISLMTWDQEDPAILVSRMPEQGNTETTLAITTDIV